MVVLSYALHACACSVRLYACFIKLGLDKLIKSCIIDLGAQHISKLYHSEMIALTACKITMPASVSGDKYSSYIDDSCLVVISRDRYSGCI